MGSRTRVLALLVSVFTITGAMGLGVAHADDVGGNPADSSARFVTRCTFSHRLADDPIVHPGMPGASHLHDFFGNTTTNAKSTLRKLKQGTTTCVNPSDLSGYWTPSLKVNGVLVDPTAGERLLLEQRQGLPHDQGAAARPRGRRRQRDGDHAAGHEDHDVGLRRRQQRAAGRRRADVPDGDARAARELPRLLGRRAPRLREPREPPRVQRQGHVPAGYPVAIPRIHVNVRYPTTGGPTTELSSGGQYSGHADFFNVWVPKELKRLVKTCINRGSSATPRPDRHAARHW